VAERSASPRIAVEERLFSLVLALLATEQGLTKTEVLSTVQGYRQKFVVGGDNTSLERQFERDKDDIRELGIPLETIEAPESSGNNQLLRYLIPKGAYDLPADITFSSAEIAMLSLAATVWRQGSLSGESQRAILKLRSLGIESTEPVIGYAPRVRTRENAFDPLRTALDRHQVVTFVYVKPGGSAPRLRTVHPLALVQYRGRWHLSAYDEGVKDRRTFLLSRIVGVVKVKNRTFEAPVETGLAERALEELDALWQANVARVRVAPGSDAEARLGKRGTRVDADADEPTIELHYTDVDLLADELAGYGPEAEAVSPERLRAGVIARHRRTLEAHARLNDDTDADTDADGSAGDSSAADAGSARPIGGRHGS
jgi:proteasome accessory factor B